MQNKIIAGDLTNTIMLVNDDFIHLMVIQNGIEKHYKNCPGEHQYCKDLNYTAFTHPSDAIAFLKAKTETFTGRIIVLMDYDMGDKTWNGAQLTKELYKINPDIFVIANSNSPEYNKEIMLEGAKFIGAKNTTEIVKAIKVIIGCPSPYI